MKRYFVLDDYDNTIDEGDDYKRIEELMLCLNKNKLGDEAYRIVEVEVEGNLVEGVNILTYIYVNKIPKRLFLNQLRMVSDFVNEISIASLEYKNYEVVSKWFCSK